MAGNNVDITVAKDIDSLSEQDKKEIFRRLIRVRSSILIQYPFYGHLLLLMPLALEKCKTACTNMSTISFDPWFVMRISDDELRFVMLHEIMHCVLQHCIRGVGKNSYIYNIAADIVVNSNIMSNMGVKNYTIDGVNVMHSYENGKEGMAYGTEQLYEKLMRKYADILNDVEKTVKQVQEEYGVTIDNHAIWRTVPLNSAHAETWKRKLRQAAKSVKEKGNKTIPPVVKRYLDDVEYEGLINWREMLLNFIQASFSDEDYSFMPSDRRFSYSDYIMPAFMPTEVEAIRDLWFLIDVSGSVGISTINTVFKEVEATVDQFGSVDIKVSYFDHTISNPITYKDTKDFDNLKVGTGGGTDFIGIFEYMKKHMSNTLPKAVVIITDGEAEWPKEEASMGVPVLWVIADNEKIDAPWGINIHIMSESDSFLRIPEVGLL